MLDVFQANREAGNNCQTQLTELLFHVMHRISLVIEKAVQGHEFLEHMNCIAEPFFDRLLYLLLSWLLHPFLLALSQANHNSMLLLGMTQFGLEINSNEERTHSTQP